MSNCVCRHSGRSANASTSVYSPLCLRAQIVVLYIARSSIAADFSVINRRINRPAIGVRRSLITNVCCFHWMSAAKLCVRRQPQHPRRNVEYFASVCKLPTPLLSYTTARVLNLAKIIFICSSINKSVSCSEVRTVGN